MFVEPAIISQVLKTLSILLNFISISLVFFLVFFSFTPFFKLDNFY